MISEDSPTIPTSDAKRYRIVVRSAEEAVRLIREKLGDQAKVVSVKQIGGEGLKRFISSPKLEVIAELGSPEKNEDILSSDPEFAGESLSSVPAKSLATQDVQSEAPQQAEQTTLALDKNQTHDYIEEGDALSVLAKAGFDPVFLSEIKTLPDMSDVKDLSLADLLKKVTLCLSDRFRSIPHKHTGSKIAILGSPGSGKTTLLCKLLAHEVFIKKKLPMVLKLENGIPNPDDSLRIFCEVIGVTLYREPNKVPPSSVDSPLFIDIPGISLNDVGEWSTVNSSLNQLGVQTRLFVVNGAYDSKVLNKCIRISSNLEATHLAVSHFDELSNASKLWPIILDSGLFPYCISNGQNVTGDFSFYVLNQMISKSFPENLYSQTFSSYPQSV